MRKKVALFFLGLVLILFGVLWGGDSVGLWHIDLFFNGWWSLFFIVLPIYGMIRHGVKGFDLIILAIGLLILFSGIGLIDWQRIRLLFWPCLVILLGLYLIFGVFKRKPSPALEREAAARVSATFGSVKSSCDGRPYDGGVVDADFGGAELDLRNAIIEKDISMNVSACFGAVKICFPPHVRVEAENHSFFGAVKNNVGENTAVNAPVVRVRCSAVFGGIELY